MGVKPRSQSKAAHKVRVEHQCAASCALLLPQAWLRAVGFPLAKGVAEFYARRVGALAPLKLQSRFSTLSSRRGPGIPSILNILGIHSATHTPGYT